MAMLALMMTCYGGGVVDKHLGLSTIHDIVRSLLDVLSLLWQSVMADCAVVGHFLLAVLLLLQLALSQIHVPQVLSHLGQHA